VPSCPLRADHKQVESLVLDADAELNRFQGSVLAGYLDDLMNFIGRPEGKHLQRASQARAFRVDLLYGHFSPLPFFVV
jgi:hypothetical protein